MSGVDSDPLLCGMESISRDGNCNRPASHIWRHRDGSTPVCPRCLLSVLVCGGVLEIILEDKKEQPSH